MALLALIFNKFFESNIFDFVGLGLMKELLRWMEHGMALAQSAISNL